MLARSTISSIIVIDVPGNFVCGCSSIEPCLQLCILLLASLEICLQSTIQLIPYEQLSLSSSTEELDLRFSISRLNQSWKCLKASGTPGCVTRSPAPAIVTSREWAFYLNGIAIRWESFQIERLGACEMSSAGFTDFSWLFACFQRFRIGSGA